MGLAPDLRRPLGCAALLCLLARAAAAAEPEPGPPPDPATAQAPAAGSHALPPSLPADPAARLEGAIRSYHAGQQDLALSLLTALIRDAAHDPEIVRDARLYMAEILLFQGNEAGAREAVELVLRDHPDLILDPFRHPPDICAFFELVKASGSWRPQPPPALVEPAPRRTSPWLPLGISQARQGRPVAAGLLATGQGLSCGLSAGLFLWIAVDRRYGSEGEPGFTDDGQRLWSLDTLQARRAAQWASTATCYASYGLGVLDASVAGRRARRQATIGLAPGPGLAVAARF
ncbi:hypothetical protein L6R53_04390 [Myxococcota bacterium]|nr:hypothetical protein [Myxococcota bacterium]